MQNRKNAIIKAMAIVIGAFFGKNTAQAQERLDTHPPKPTASEDGFYFSSGKSQAIWAVPPIAGSIQLTLCDPGEHSYAFGGITIEYHGRKVTLTGKEIMDALEDTGDH